MDEQHSDSNDPAGAQAPGSRPATSQEKQSFLSTTAGHVTIWVGLATGVITLIAAVLQYLAVRPVKHDELAQGSTSASRSQHFAEDAGQSDANSGGEGHFDYSKVSSEVPGSQQPSYEGVDLYSINYNLASFAPGYDIYLPDCGAVIDPAESDWPEDPQVMLVWHGNPDSPVADIVVRVTELASDSYSDFDSWLNMTANSLRNDPANRPEGQLASYEYNGYTWHNLPMSRYNSLAGYQEAIDINLAQYGYEAIGVTFYFPVPPAPGLLDSLIPQVLGNVDLSPPAESAAAESAPADGATAGAAEADVYNGGG